MKVCSNCKIEKELIDFHKQPKNKDGCKNKCKQCLCKCEKNRYEINKLEILEKQKIYFKQNKDKKNLYVKNKTLTNPLFKLKRNINCLISSSIKNNNYIKVSRTNKILGCSNEYFKVYIENQFINGMSWENRQEWHLDHIYPVSLAKDEEELIRLNHYTNFQPLWAKDNLQKGNKIINNKQLKLL
jgi:hypothetical protein